MTKFDNDILGELGDEFIKTGTNPEYRDGLKAKYRWLRKIFPDKLQFPPERIARLAAIGVGAGIANRDKPE